MAVKVTAWDRVIAGLPGVVDRGVHRAGTMVCNMAVQFAPEKTGALKRSGHVEPPTPDGSGMVRIVFDVPYAVYVERGTNDPTYPAQPFLGPAQKEIDVKREIAHEVRMLMGRS